MTSKSRNAVRGFEAEIEKSREESNWKKSLELAQQLLTTTKSPQQESLAHFLIGESKLEAYLDENPPSKDNFEQAQRELKEAQGYLSLSTEAAGARARVALDAHLLLGKLQYACGEHDAALAQYARAELDSLTEKELSLRSLRVVAESYAVKGLCLEQGALPASTSKYRAAERDAEMIRCFELAADLALLYLQRGPASGRAGPTLETALQRAPILHMRAGRLHRAIDRYREMLSAVESASTQALRLTLARQLAEVLMRGVTGQVYKAPERTPSLSQQGTLSRRKEEYMSEGPWKPKKYAGINQFVPCNEYEEVMLVLVVGEALAAREAVLSQSAEFLAAREHAMRNAVLVLDLLALAATRWGRLCLVLEALERAMKFSFGRRHVWRQRALATAAAANTAHTPRPGSAAWGAGVRAMAVMRHAAPLAAADPALRLVGARGCYAARRIEEGLELAQAALALTEENGGPLRARCCLMCGLGQQLLAQRTNSRPEKEAANEASLKFLQRSVQLDSRDHLAFYHLALQYMRMARLNEAMEATRGCLAARASCGGGLRLAAALWGLAPPARRHRALRAAALAAAQRPAAAWPRRAMLRAPPQAALASAKELLTLLNSPEAEPEPEPECNGYAELDAMSGSQPWDDAQSNRDATSIGAESVATCCVERALGAATPARHAQRAHAWLLLGDLCLRLDRVSAAAGCVSEAATLTPFSHLVFHSRGLVHAASGEWEEARQCFQNALAVHPTHLDSMVHLGTAYYELGWLRLAEKALREAVALDGRRGDSWRRLALVLAALGEPAAAADAAAAALCVRV